MPHLSCQRLNFLKSLWRWTSKVSGANLCRVSPRLLPLPALPHALPPLSSIAKSLASFPSPSLRAVGSLLFNLHICVYSLHKNRAKSVPGRQVFFVRLPFLSLSDFSEHEMWLLILIASDGEPRGDQTKGQPSAKERGSVQARAATRL